MNYIPYVIEQVGHIERSYDIFSRLLKDRIIFIGSEVTDQIANVVCAELLFLEADDPDKDISIYINSQGGMVSSGMAIFDTMNYIKPDVATIAIGTAASMAALLLAAGTKGKRSALPNSKIIIHQPAGGMRGAASDIDIHTRELLKTRDRLNEILAEATGKSIKTIAKDTDRDFIMTAEEANKYGLIDKVIAKRVEVTDKTEERETKGRK